MEDRKFRITCWSGLSILWIDDAWSVLKNEGYLNQYEGNWKTVNDVLMTGRAVTAMYMPSRPDVEKNIKDRGATTGKKR